MPTEELFGAYHFLLESADDGSSDSFDFKTETDETQVAMLLPAVQAAREAARRTEAEEPVDYLQIETPQQEAVLIGLLLPAVQKATDGHDKWIDVLSVNQGVNRDGGGDDFMF